MSDFLDLIASYISGVNRFILLIHDLTKTDLEDLDALANGYLKSWLGMPRSGSFLPVYSGLGMDVKSVSHLYKKSRSFDIVRALIQWDHTVQTSVQAKVQLEQKWTRKSAISVHTTKIAGIVLSSTEPGLGEFFKMRNGLLGSADILCRETSSLFCRLRMKASHRSCTCGTFLMVS
jgi:hypothetical protein